MTTTTTPQRITLRDYQEKHLQDVDAAIAAGEMRPLIEVPTGGGKTIIFNEWAERRGGRTLIAAPGEELVNQAIEKYRMLYPDVHIGKVQANVNEIDAQVVVASVDTITQWHRFQQLGAFDQAIFDEAHHAPAPTYRKLVEEWLADIPVLGVTATATHNKENLGELFRLVSTTTILELISKGYLCDIRAIRVMLEKLDLRRVKMNRGDYSAGSLGDELEKADAPEHVVAGYKEHAMGRKGICFTPTVRTAHLMAEEFARNGIPAEAVDASTPKEERRAMIRRFQTGETMVMANCGVLTEGFDEPSVNCIMMARPTRSGILFRQCVGRGLRIFPGKADCLLLDFAANTATHGLQSIARLFGVKAEEVEVEDGMSILEAVRAEAWDEESPLAPEEVRRVHEIVSLFDRHELTWLKVDAQTFALSAGDVSVVLEMEADGTWTVAEFSQDSNRRTVRTVVAEGLDLGYAQGRGEEIARDAGGGALINKKARWRKDKIGPAQIELMNGKGIVFPTRIVEGAHGKVEVPDVNKGEASDLISMYFLKRDIARFRRDRERAAGKSATTPAAPAAPTPTKPKPSHMASADDPIPF